MFDRVSGDPMPAFGLEVARLHARRTGAPEPSAADPALLLDYAAGRPPIYAYGDVLAGRIPDAAIAGRIVLVGATAIELQDLRATPLGVLTPGVQVQGHVADTLLRGSAPRPVEGLPALALAIALGLPSLVAARGRARVAGLFVAALPAPAGLGVALAVAPAGVFLSVGPFCVAGLAAAVGHGVAEWAELRQELARVRTRLQALADFGRRADPSRGLEQSTQTVLAVVRDLLGLERLAVELPDGRTVQPPDGDREAPAGVGPEMEVPIVAAAGARGRLVAALPRGRRFGPDEQSLLEAIAARIGVDSTNRSLAADLQAVHLSVIHSLAVAIEMRNAYTGQHCEGVARRAAALAEAFGLDGQAVEKIRIGGLLHDIGKIGIPESILLKPGRFTPEEYAVMKQHSEIGHKIIATLPFAEEVKDYVRHHHERYDGSGYPDGLAGAQLSLGARIVAVADCYEALVTDRPYRAGVRPAEALAYIQSRRGAFFDPDVVDRLEGVLRAEGAPIDEPVPTDAPWHR
jgi:putative nucleotidyltransferase with HDIG domain